MTQYIFLQRLHFNKIKHPWRHVNKNSIESSSENIKMKPSNKKICQKGSKYYTEVNVRETLSENTHYIHSCRWRVEHTHGKSWYFHFVRWKCHEVRYMNTIIANLNIDDQMHRPHWQFFSFQFGRFIYWTRLFFRVRSSDISFGICAVISSTLHLNHIFSPSLSSNVLHGTLSRTHSQQQLMAH